MKQYRVKLDTIIEGKPLRKDETVTLSDEKAKPYQKAGLLEPDKAEEEKPVAKSEAKAKD